MTNETDISIQLRRTRGGRPRGLVIRDTEQRAFVGWVGLIAALSEMMADSAVAPDDLGREGDT